MVSGGLDDLKGRYQCLRVVFQHGPPPVSWLEGAEHVRQEGKTVSILASHNVEALVQQARSLPGVSVERHPVSLKEIFLEHVGSN